MLHCPFFSCWSKTLALSILVSKSNQSMPVLICTSLYIHIFLVECVLSCIIDRKSIQATGEGRAYLCAQQGWQRPCSHIGISKKTVCPFSGSALLKWQAVLPGTSHWMNGIHPDFDDYLLLLEIFTLRDIWCFVFASYVSLMPVELLRCGSRCCSYGRVLRTGEKPAGEAHPQSCGFGRPG